MKKVVKRCIIAISVTLLLVNLNVLFGPKVYGFSGSACDQAIGLVMGWYCEVTDAMNQQIYIQERDFIECPSHPPCATGGELCCLYFTKQGGVG